MGVHWANSTMGVVMALSESEPGAAFPGVIGRTTDVSSPAWPVAARPAPGTPNVLVVVLDGTAPQVTAMGA